MIFYTFWYFIHSSLATQSITLTFQKIQYVDFKGFRKFTYFCVYSEYS